MSPTELRQFPALNLRAMTEVLIKHHGVHEGFYELSIQFSMAFGTLGPTQAEALPGALLGVSGIGLAQVKAENTHPNVVDAAAVNPAKKSRKPSVKKST